VSYLPNSTRDVESVLSFIRAAYKLLKHVRERVERADQIARSAGVHRITAVTSPLDRDCADALAHLDDAAGELEMLSLTDGAA